MDLLGESISTISPANIHVDERHDEMIMQDLSSVELFNGPSGMLLRCTSRFNII